jgi:hypothetical protein
MGKFAATTTVSVEKSEVELKQTLRRYGVGDIATLSRPGLASVMFSKGERAVRFELEVPPLEDLMNAWIEQQYPSAARAGRVQKWHYEKAQPKAKTQWQQEEKRIWRVLIMVIKAHFEMAEETGFDTAFAANILLPGGETIAEYMLPRLDHARETGLLPDPFAELMPRRALPAPKED